MDKASKSTRIFFGLILLYAILAAVNVYLPTYEALAPKAELPAPKPILALANAGIAMIPYGALGYIGLRLSRKLEFPEIWDDRVTNRQRFLVPALIGASLGVFLIMSDLVFSRFNGVGQLIHPPFPASIVASLAAGIGEETLFRLFFIPFWMWLISSVITQGKRQNQVFWVASSCSALTFALGHLPALMVLYGFKTVSEIPLALTTEIILLNGVVSIFAAYYMRKHGFLAAAGIHFWTDALWHVIWGLF